MILCISWKFLFFVRTFLLKGVSFCMELNVFEQKLGYNETKTSKSTTFCSKAILLGQKNVPACLKPVHNLVLL